MKYLQATQVPTSLGVTFYDLGLSVATRDRTPISRMQGERFTSAPPRRHTGNMNEIFWDGM